MSRFKVNDIVTVDGHSVWGRCLTDRAKGKCAGGLQRQFRVLGVDCRIPVDGDKIANTLLAALDTGHIWAINDCNILAFRDIRIRFFSAGKDITDELSPYNQNAILNANK